MSAPEGGNTLSTQVNGCAWMEEHMACDICIPRTASFTEFEKKSKVKLAIYPGYVGRALPFDGTRPVHCSSRGFDRAFKITNLNERHRV